MPNRALRALYDADRADHRRGLRHGTPEYVAMCERDRQRRASASALVASVASLTPDDLYHAAAVFQHGDDPDDAWEAHVLAGRAAALGHGAARWLTAAAYDRWCMYRGEPQRYGTQYVSDGQRHRLWDVDPATTDVERAAWDVPPLTEQLRKADEATRVDPPGPVGADAPGWLLDALRRWGTEGR